MEQDTQDLIDEFLLNKMDMAGTAAFENMMAVDDSLRSSVCLQKLITSRLAARKRKLERIKRWEMDRVPYRHAPSISLGWSMVCAVVIALCVTVFTFTKDRNLLDRAFYESVMSGDSYVLNNTVIKECWDSQDYSGALDVIDKHIAIEMDKKSIDELHWAKVQTCLLCEDFESARQELATYSFEEGEYKKSAEKLGNKLNHRNKYQK